MHAVHGLLVAIAAFAGCGALAQDPNFDSIDRPLKNEKIQAGETYTITWTLLKPDTPTGPVTITLIGGTSTQALNPITPIGHVNNDARKFAWAVSATLGGETVYGLNISLDADQSHFQYSNPFQIVGGTSAPVATSTTVTVTANSTLPPVVTTFTSTVMTGSGSTEIFIPSSTASEPATTSATLTSASNVTGSPSPSATVASVSNTTVTTSTPTAVSTSGSSSLKISAMTSALMLGLAAIWGL